MAEELPSVSEEELRKLSPAARIRRLKDLEVARQQFLERQRQAAQSQAAASEEIIRETEEELEEETLEERVPEHDEESLEEIVRTEAPTEEETSLYATRETYRPGPGLEYGIANPYENRMEAPGRASEYQQTELEEQRRKQEENYRGPQELGERHMEDSYSTRKGEGLSTNILKDLYKR